MNPTQQRKVLSTINQATVVDHFFDKMLEVDLGSQNRSPSHKVLGVSSLSSEPMFPSPPPGENIYDDDFEATSPSPVKIFSLETLNAPSIQKVISSPKEFLESLNSSSGMQPARLLLSGLDSSGYDDDFEQASPSPKKQEDENLTTGSEYFDVDALNGLIATTARRENDILQKLYESLGIDPDSAIGCEPIPTNSSHNVHMQSNKLKIKKNPKKKKVLVLSPQSLNEEEKKKCAECSKLFYVPAKYIPNVKTMDQPAVDVVKNMIAQNKEPKKSSDVSLTNRRCFCTWRCAKKWNQKHTSLQLRYHTDVMIDFAAALSSEA